MQKRRDDSTAVPPPCPIAHYSALMTLWLSRPEFVADNTLHLRSH